MSDEKKKSKTVSDAPRRNLYMEWPEDLVIPTDENHPLYDPRGRVPVNENLVRNIMKHRVYEPILVCKMDDQINVIDGRQRVKAAREANRRLRESGCVPKRVPTVYENKATDAERYGMLIATNEGRLEESAIEKARKVNTYISYGYTEAEAAETFCVNPQTIRNWLSLLDLAPDIQKAVEDKEITPTAASKLANLEPEEQKAKLGELKEAGGKLTVERVARVAKGGDITPPKKLRTRTEIENRLSLREDDPAEYGQGYSDALRWVLCEDKPVEVAE